MINSVVLKEFGLPLVQQQEVRHGILRKGLCIVFLPLLINTVFICLLNFSLDHASRLMEESRRQIAAISTLSRDLFTVTGLLTCGNNAMMNGSFNFFNPMIKGFLDTLEKDLDLVAPKLPADLHFEKTRNEMQALIQTQRAVFIKAEDRSHRTDDLLIKLSRTKDWIRLCGKESILLNSTLANVQERFEQSVQVQKREQNFTATIVAVGLLLNLLLACFLAWYAHRYFATRLSLLIKMAKQLPSHQPLREKLDGKDELSYLASELSNVSTDLANIAEYRRSLAQMMAHDVRSPLMGANISVELLSSAAGDKLTSSGTQLLKSARTSIGGCLAIVSDLLLLESFDNGELKLDIQTHDIYDLVSHAVNKVAPAASSKQLQLRIDVPDQFLQFDTEQMSLVLERMLASAVERAPANSTVTIASNTENNILNICVTDSGTPLDRSAQEELFDKFHQARNDTETFEPGLGLAVAKPIAALHGAEISARNTDTGNVLNLRLPLDPDRSVSEGQ